MKREKRLPQTVVRLPVSGKPLTVLTVALIVTSALFLTGCATHRKSVTAGSVEQVAETVSTDSAVRLSLDSVSELVEIRTEPVKVPMSEVSLTIATDSLRRLPVGASYSERSGQASVKVSRKAATATEPEYIYVYATCDSLQLQCERYERTIRNLHKDYGEQLNGLKIRLAESKQELQELEEKPPNPIGTALKWYLAGLVSGIIGTIIIFIKLKK
jgi:hypothetical protein